MRAGFRQRNRATFGVKGRGVAHLFANERRVQVNFAEGRKDESRREGEAIDQDPCRAPFERLKEGKVGQEVSAGVASEVDDNRAGLHAFDGSQGRSNAVSGFRCVVVGE